MLLRIQKAVREISGSFGDFGTLLPILVSLSATNQINLTASLVFGGTFNIISGFYFGIPMCVQPMKSVAGIALLANLSMHEITSAGLSVSIALILFAMTGMIKILNDCIPLYIVRGLQLGSGLVLISKGITTILTSKGWSFAGYDWGDNYTIAMLAYILVMIGWNSKRTGSALILFLFGLIVSCTRVKLSLLSFGPNFIMPFVPTPNQFWTGFFKAGLGQIPLTVSNSVIAVSLLASDLFPKNDSTRTDVTRISIWVAAMNITSAWFGSVPYCCGSGGLAAQYRFGARTGSSVIFLGVLKLLSGLLFGNSLGLLFSKIPNSIIGVLLVVSGLQLALITVNFGSYPSISKRDNAYLCMMITAVSVLGFANDGIGFLIGVASAILLHITDQMETLADDDEKNSLKQVIER